MANILLALEKCSIGIHLTWTLCLGLNLGIPRASKTTRVHYLFVTGPRVFAQILTIASSPALRAPVIILDVC